MICNALCFQIIQLSWLIYLDIIYVCIYIYTYICIDMHHSLDDMGKDAEVFGLVFTLFFHLLRDVDPLLGDQKNC